MIVFTRLGGGRGSVGVRGMLVFTRLGGGRRHTAATGFAGISTDAALPLSKVASVLSRVYFYWISGRNKLFTVLCCTHAQIQSNTDLRVVPYGIRWDTLIVVNSKFSVSTFA